MRLLGVAAIALAGCDVAWSVPEVHRFDAAIDAPPIDAAPDALTCFMTEQVAEADVILFQTTPFMGQPTSPIMNVSVSVQSQALVRFSLPILGPGQVIRKIALHAPYVTQAKDCNGGVLCGPCTNMSKIGRFDIEYASSAWDEASACYDHPTTGSNWELKGALGPMDRSESVGFQNYVTAQDLDVALDASKLPAWISADNKVSVIVTPSNGAATIVPQKEYATMDNCAPDTPKVRLSIMVCQ